MATITIVYQQTTLKIQLSEKKNLLSILLENHIPIYAPCAGNGTCGKCLVHLKYENSSETVCACKTVVQKDCIVEIPDSSLVSSTKLESKHSTMSVDPLKDYGIAVDLGTTTVAVALVSLHSGQVLSIQREWNVQISYGSDVLSRLKYIMDHSKALVMLSDQIQKQIFQMIQELRSKHHIPYQQIKKMVISGNTIMQHIFAGINPTSIATAPYIPNTYFLEPDFFHFERFFDIPILFLPCISSYVGGDITAGLLSSGLYKKEGTFLFLDIGTNGEMAIGGKDGFLTCSVASGPAFEGAEINCGMPGNVGAINHIRFMEQQCKFQMQTIGNTIPIGICGSGLIDLIAVLLEIGLIDPTGRLLSTSEAKKTLSRLTLSRLRNSLGYRFLSDDNSGNGIFYLKHNPDIYLKIGDVRKFQMAKAAVAAGIQVLLKRAKMQFDDIDGLYLAGSFGEHLEIKNAAKIGMIPMELIDRVFCLGNTSLSGAIHCLIDPNMHSLASSIAKKAGYIELSEDPSFQAEFIAHMDFLR